MTRFVDETFQPSFVPTIGVDFKVRTLMIDDYQCKVQIWLVQNSRFNQKKAVFAQISHQST